MIQSAMLTCVERLFHSALINHYPEWFLKPRIVALGRRIRTRIDGYSFDIRLLMIENPSFFSVVHSSYAEARAATLMTYSSYVHTFTQGAFEDCYFLRLADAENFYRVVFFFRFFFAMTHSTIKGIAFVLFDRRDCGLSNWDLRKISLKTYYHSNGLATS